MQNQPNRRFEPMLVVGFTTLILIVLSAYEYRFSLGRFTSKPVSLLSEISIRGSVKDVPSTHFLLNDSIFNRHQKMVELKKFDKTTITDFGPDTARALELFFSSLDSAKTGKKKIRVAYFGDSVIEGDLLTQDLRNYLQQRYGGAGVGFMPVTSIVSTFRKTIQHTYSDNWEDHTLLENISWAHPLGITGHVFHPAIPEEGSDSSFGESWVRYSAVARKRLDKFYNVKLYFGKTPGENSVNVNGKKIKLSGNSVLNEQTLNEKPLRSLVVGFQCKTPLNVFGFSFEGDTGAYVDNFSFRGNSGMPLTKMNAAVLSRLDQYLGYDLIVLQYGVNVASSEVTDYSWYVDGMTRVISHLKKCFPGASILLISAGDRAIKEEEKYVTDPAIPLLVEMQKVIARKNRIAFWNLYEAMGGNGSIVKWAAADTSLATRDYIHFNARGGAKIAGMLFRNLMGDYGDYKKIKQKILNPKR